MQYSSSYELKKALKRLGYSLEGLKVIQLDNNKFRLCPLNPDDLFFKTGEFKNTSTNMHLMAVINELSKVLKDTNIEVGIRDGDC